MCDHRAACLSHRRSCVLLLDCDMLPPRRFHQLAERHPVDLHYRDDQHLYPLRATPRCGAAVLARSIRFVHVFLWCRIVVVCFCRTLDPVTGRCGRLAILGRPIKIATCLGQVAIHYGGGENCTPVPRHIHGSFYARSRQFFISRRGPPIDRLSSVAIPKLF